MMAWERTWPYCPHHQQQVLLSYGLQYAFHPMVLEVPPCPNYLPSLSLQENEKLDVLVKKQRAEVLKLQGNLEKAVSFFSCMTVCV